MDQFQTYLETLQSSPYHAVLSDIALNLESDMYTTAKGLLNSKHYSPLFIDWCGTFIECLDNQEWIHF